MTDSSDAAEVSEDGSWLSIHYTLDDQAWGFLIEHADDGVYSYRVEDRWIVPSFRRFEHAALFAKQFPGGPALERGGSYDLGPVLAYATQDGAAAPENLEDAWWLLLDVADAGEDDALLESPEEAEDPKEALGACFEAFHRAVLHLDG